MNMDRNENIIEHIISYCDEIQGTIERFGNDFDTFKNDYIFRNACAMCILQIGELTGTLTEEFRLQYNGVPWRQIRGMRNIVAHGYGSISIEATWETICEDIPVLKEYCQQILDNKTNC